MIRQLMLAAGLVGLGVSIQGWSSFRRRDLWRVQQVEVPRWEDEGGSPAPDGAADEIGTLRPDSR